MKRFAGLFLCVMLASVSANAQGKWSKHMTKGDELKEIPAGEYYKYTVDTLGAVTIRDFNDWNLEVETFKGNFCGGQTTSSGGWQVPYVEIRMGLYDASGQLIEKLFQNIEGDYNWNYRSAHTSEHWLTTPQIRGKFKKMIKAMQSVDGYVRILIKRMNMADFDLKITPYNKQN